jgi:ribosomal-protein-alanine N-acetyltransferase
MTAMTRFDVANDRVGIRRPTPADADEFVALMLASRALHEPWVDFSKSAEAYAAYLATRDRMHNDAFLICDAADGRIAGVINLNAIVRGFFQSAYLGYGIGAPYSGRGYMTAGMRLVTTHAFGAMGLHRLEANIQPANLASIALVKRCGFHREGFSPRYLKVAGQWRDHERWALLAEDGSPAQQGVDGIR